MISRGLHRSPELVPWISRTSGFSKTSPRLNGERLPKELENRGKTRRNEKKGWGCRRLGRGPSNRFALGACSRLLPEVETTSGNRGTAENMGKNDRAVLATRSHETITLPHNEVHTAFTSV